MAMQALIVDVGIGERHLDARKSLPRALETEGFDDRPLLDWIVHALARRAVTDPIYVGRYHIEKVISHFPGLRFRYLGTEEVGEVAALLECAPAERQDLLIVVAGTFLLPDALVAIPPVPVQAASYAAKQGRRPLGVWHVRADRIGGFLSEGRRLLAAAPRASFGDLAAHLDRVGVAVADWSLDGLAAPVEDREAVARLIFRGKGQALEILASVSGSSAFVAEPTRFAVAAWQRDRAALLRQVAERHVGTRVIVRSNTVAEDALSGSAAGRFRSILDVPADDASAVAEAVDQVIASYQAGGRPINPADEVLIQRQILDLASSGVLLTRVPRSGAPYFVLNLDRSGRSDLVTSGGAGETETFYISWSADAGILPDELRPIVALGRELMRLSLLDGLDIEFGVDRAGRLYLFQARPLAALPGHPAAADSDILRLKQEAHAFVVRRMAPLSGLAGTSTVLGTMPDWNPVEMIGRNPRPLALSLYQTLVGDGSWAEARARIGYRDVTPEPLILSLGGRPYVDVRSSLNSLLPANLPETLATRWVDAGLERLRAEPELHDKLEFEIAITCLSPDWPQLRPRLVAAGFSADEIVLFRDHLRRLTNDIICDRVEPVDRQFAALARLDERRRIILADRGDDLATLGRRIRHLLEDCRRFGVVPFAVLARYAFVAISFLRGLTAVGVLDPDDADAFLRAVPTVASQFTEDLHGLAENRCTQAELIASYGHLRPNSYEITSPNYAAEPDKVFRPLHRGEAAAPAAGTSVAEAILLQHRSRIDAALTALGLEIDTPRLIRFLIAGITGRERAKFEFMKNLDAALETIARVGTAVGLGREALSFVPVSEFLRLETDSPSGAVDSQLRRTIGFHEKRWHLTNALMTPEVIGRPEDLWLFRLERWRANFVTRKRVVAAPCVLDDQTVPASLDGRIVMIRAADPGFDWIFAHRIAGLVTQYGGVASHMAIRAAEFGLPAAIGCGLATFSRLAAAAMIELDCGNEVLRSLD